MPDSHPPIIKGRGAQIRPANRFEKTHRVPDPAASDSIAEGEALEILDVETRATCSAQRPRIETEFIADGSRSIIAENDSPDVGFRYSVNPYRGCEHGCAYCYARPSHEYLGYDAGLDFESKILVKYEAPELLREELSKPRWRAEMICFSGNTDCYQPAEERLTITRRCLEIALDARQPVGIITKNALVLRDLDLLTEMAQRQLVHVNLSVTTLDAKLARQLEPRTSTPDARLQAIRELSRANIPVRVMVAPTIPGLTDEEMPAILGAAHEAGAASAGYVLLRLPLAVEPIFRDWLAQHYPLKQARIEQLIKATRGGKFYQSKRIERQRGVGTYAQQIAQNFQVFARRFQLDRPLPPLNSTNFRSPQVGDRQQTLF